MRYFLYGIFTLFTLQLATTAVAQVRTLNIYDKNRSKKEEYYNRYDLDRFIEQQDEEARRRVQSEDTSKINRIMVTPEELRKLGIPEETIEELLDLSAAQDTLEMIKDEVKRKEFEKRQKGKKDSVSIEDVIQLIEFQKRDLVEKALKLPEPVVYGQEFFRRNLLEVVFKNELNERPPDNYPLGIGDEVTVSMWGTIDYNKKFTIDTLGNINPDLVGRINLKGLNMNNAKEVIKNKFAKVYEFDPAKIDVSITYMHKISVNFVGELLHPGTYRFPANTSVFNALVAINGPNQIGSLRQIYIRRNGTTVKTLDIYEYLTNPNSREDFFLQHNDYVVIPPMGGVVNISGQIRRTHNYELRGGEGLQRVIDFAGGLNADAFTKNINIKRYQGNKEILIDLDIDSLRQYKTDFPLINGDSIFVYKVPKGLRNYVEVVGAVKVPGKYEVVPGNRVSDILLKTEGVLDEADLSRAYVIRLKEDQSKLILPFKLGEVLENPKSAENIAIQDLDTIQVVSRKDFRQDFSVKIFGAVRQSGEYEYAEGLTLKDLLYLAGGMQAEAASERLEISRLINYTDPDTKRPATDRIVVKRVQVNPDLTIDTVAANFSLKPYDHVFVRISPNFEPPQIVKIYGEVTYPGEYTLLSKEERLTSLIERTGGTTLYAFRQGARLYRSQDSTGYVLLDVDKAIAKPNKSKFNYILSDGDSIFVPKVKNVVTLRGAVSHFDVDSVVMQISVPFEKGKKRAKYYINRYGGGFGRFAKKSRTYVQQANGRIDKARSFMGIKRYPKVENGATVFVDITDRKRFEADRRDRRKNRNWNDAFDSLTSKIATILTVLVLVQQATR
ncbi:hypothetical protein C7N43_15175 [Sphingobacteriales bacterium UPWRP_1]|nr:hypothetical protein BVG80_09025 [Sphingobacteriales bacterium TSM_CSM]PSJ76180.1 hypothetical protein C7N43_15175 [Sphingobacteriales bacterium UPWRP_1]